LPARRPDTTAAPPSPPFRATAALAHLRALTPPRTHTVVAAVAAPWPQPSSPRLAVNRRRVRHHAAAW
jgi:hypothetical protein